MQLRGPLCADNLSSRTASLALLFALGGGFLFFAGSLPASAETTDPTPIPVPSATDIGAPSATAAPTDAPLPTVTDVPPTETPADAVASTPALSTPEHTPKNEGATASSIPITTSTETLAPPSTDTVTPETAASPTEASSQDTPTPTGVPTAIATGTETSSPTATPTSTDTPALSTPEHTPKDEGATATATATSTPTPALSTPEHTPKDEGATATATATSTPTLALSTPEHTPKDEGATATPTTTPTPTVTLSPAIPTPTPIVVIGEALPPPMPAEVGAAASTTIVISQVYSGGGNVGAPYRNDLIELFNLGGSPVNVTGWSVQYAAAAGVTWQVTPLSGSIPPGGYYLVQEGSGGGAGVLLPAPDATGAINMAAGMGKVALVNNAVALVGGCPTGPNIVDFVGYGGAATCFEGVGPAPASSNTQADLRAGNGSVDTDNNSADFTTGAPNPRNSGTPAATPTPSHTPTDTLTPSTTPTSSETSTPSDTPSPSDTPTVTDTATATDTPAETPTPTDTATAPATSTATPTPTDTASPTATAIPNPSVVISQIYGGGGNAGAPYTHDFIELYNRGGTTVSLTGGSVQYAAAAGAVWQVTTLSGSIAPGGYYLVQEAAGAGCGGFPCGVNLPAPDATGTIVMSATAGKVVLVTNAVVLAGACPSSPDIVDFVGYSGAASCFEGGGPAPAPSNTSSDLRAGNGSVDTDNNSADFATGAPNPRNSIPPTVTPTPTDTSTPTDTPTPSQTPTPSDTATSTLTDTPTPTATATPVTPGAVVVNEIAWGGTGASIADEWIELYNPNGFALNLAGWTLASSTDGTPTIALTGIIPAGGYYLLERTDDTTVSDVAADQFYTGGLLDGGELLALAGPGGNVVDTANGDGGAWPGGSAAPNQYSMERISAAAPDTDANWQSHNGVNRNGLDANGNPLNGTPKQANSTTFPTPTPTDTSTPTPTGTPTTTPTPSATPTSVPPLTVVINEIAWGGTAAQFTDEWIELYNPNPFAVSLAGWTLISSTDGSPTIVLNGVIPARGYFLLERTDDTAVSDIAADQIYVGGLLNGGEALVLADLGGNIVDTANGDGGMWPAGSGSPTFYSMERISVAALDTDANWASNNGIYRNGLDANGNPLNGTPKQPNSTTLPTPTPTATDTPTATPTLGPTPTPTTTPTPSTPPTSVPPLSIVINEVAWGGAAAQFTDEWIELYNPNPFAVRLIGWTLASSTDGSPTLALTGVIPAGGYYLLERTDDTTVSDMAADQIYVGDLLNSGETLVLTDPGGNVIDTANGDGGMWPAGSGAPNHYSMERINTTSPDADANWASNNGIYRNGLDALGNPINGTPKRANSTTFPTPTPSGSATPTPTITPTGLFTSTPTPTGAGLSRVAINEVAWGGTAAQTADEWIELYNPNPFAVSLLGWTLTSSTDGTPTIALTGVIPANGYYLLERTDDATVSDIAADQIYTGDLLNGGESLLLIDAGGNAIDSANGDGGAWPAGSGSPGFYSMERISTAALDADASWASNDGVHRNGLAANGSPLNGTPKNANSTTFPAPSPTPSATAPFYPPQSVLIHEVAWAGTGASSTDEWIELYNPGPAAISLIGWTLSDGGDLDAVFPSTLVIAPGGYLLLERTSDATVSDIPADLIYSGGLNNDGEPLSLRDPIGNVIDTANGDGGAWPAGSGVTFASMERLSAGPDEAGNWHDNNGLTRNGLDANGQPLRATPRQPNSAIIPVTGYPTTVLLNEFLPHPGSGAQEFVELYNIGSDPVDISGWILDDIEGGSASYTIPDGTLIQPGAWLVFDKDTTGIALNDDGDTPRLLYPDGTVADEWSYGDDPGVNVSWARIPDGGPWTRRGIPTPGAGNRAEPEPPEPTPVPIGTYRRWNDGAWATIVGRVTVPSPVFGNRVIYIQDETGGIAIYLARGNWPALVEGQSVTVLGYLRHRTGNLEMYIRNLWHVRFGPAEEALPVTPVRVTTDQIGESTEGLLVTVTGRVSQLESDAFWIDGGSGPARAFFSAYTGLARPTVRRGETWTVTGVVVEYTTIRDAAPHYRLQPRFATDVAHHTDSRGAPLVSETPQPTEVFMEPTLTDEPTAEP